MPKSNKIICIINYQKDSENGGKSNTSKQRIKDGGLKSKKTYCIRYSWKIILAINLIREVPDTRYTRQMKG